MIVIALAFIAVAFLYASVGFGGGSTYTAILIESGLSWELVPPVSLVCNLIVVTGGVYHYARAGHLNLRFALPLIAGSVPAAFAGGLLRLQEAMFLQVLGFALLAAGLLLVLDRRWPLARPAAGSSVPLNLLLGLVLGPQMEEYFRRAMLLSRGDPMVFIERPISLGLIITTALLLVLMALPSIKKAREEAFQEEG